MENRFGIRDLILCILLILIIVGQWLAMKQYDRQWQKIEQIAGTLDEHTRDLAYLRKRLAEGVTFGQMQLAPQHSEQGFADPFDRVKKAQAMADYATGDWMVDSFGAQPPKLTPLISSDAYGSIIQNRVMESLVIRDPQTLDYKPLLARSWQQSDDGQTITFQLRKGITFSDGVPFDADDIIFSYQWMLNPEVAAPRARAFFEPIQSVEKTGPYEVVFIFKEPYFESFAMAAGFPILAKHFYGKRTPQQFNQSAGLLLGTGPYRLQSPDNWSPDGNPIMLVRNERYWGEPGSFDRLVYKIVADASVQLTLFKNGELDSFGALPEQYRDLLQDKQVLADNQRFEYYNPRGGYGYIAWNQQRNAKPTIFGDQRVRQAMTLMSDRQRMCDEVFLGYASPANGPFNFLGKQADPDVKTWPFDLERAAELLKQAGFEDRNGDGVLEFQKGHTTTLDLPDATPFRFKLSYPASNKTYQRIMLFFKDTYARSGVALDPDPVDWPIMIQKLNNRDFDAISLRWTSGFEVDIYQMFHSDQIADNADNFMSYSNPELDTLIDKARRTVDENKRMPLWRACHRILLEDQPYTFLFRNKSLAFIDKRIGNVQRTRAGLNYVSLWVYPMEWYVPASLRKWSR